jgi:hypothetical protein
MNCCVSCSISRGSAGNLTDAEHMLAVTLPAGSGTVQGVHCEVPGAQRNSDVAGGQRHRRGGRDAKAKVVRGESCGTVTSVRQQHTSRIDHKRRRKGLQLLGCLS